MKILNILTPKRLIGNLGERAAARYLKRRGYKILERNYVNSGHEIDIIARKNSITVFIEVKTRTVGHQDPREPRPASSVNATKQKAIIETARRYLSAHRTESRKRFDIIEVYTEYTGKKYIIKDIRHLENTFNINTAYTPYKK